MFKGHITIIYIYIYIILSTNFTSVFLIHTKEVQLSDLVRTTLLTSLSFTQRLHDLNQAVWIILSCHISSLWF